MKWFLIVIAATFLVACSDKKDEANAERKQSLEHMYKTPPKSDRSKNEGF